MRRAIALALSYLAACSAGQRTEPFVLRIVSAGDLAPLGPSVTVTTTAAAVDLVYQSLLRPGKNGELEPAAAKAWERIAPDRIRVQLDPALSFSDGSPVQAEDVVASLAAAGLEARAAGGWVEIGRGPSRDPLDVDVLYAPVYKRSESVPLGTGPFAFVEGDARHIVLRRVQAVAGRIARVEFQAAPTTRDAFALALRGEANAILNLDDRQAELLEGVPRLRIVRGQGPHAVAVWMNASRLGPAERSALAASLSVAELARAYGNGCEPLGAASAPGNVPLGHPLQVAAPSHDPALPRTGLALRRILGPRGGDLVVEPSAPYLARLRARDFDLAMRTVIAWPPAVLGLFTHTGGVFNWGAYSNPRVDQAFDRGDASAARDELRRDPPLVLVCRRERIAAVDSRIHDATLGTWGQLETLPDWEVSP